MTPSSHPRWAGEAARLQASVQPPPPLTGAARSSLAPTSATTGQEPRARSLSVIGGLVTALAAAVVALIWLQLTRSTPAFGEATAARALLAATPATPAAPGAANFETTAMPQPMPTEPSAQPELAAEPRTAAAVTATTAAPPAPPTATTEAPTPAAAATEQPPVQAPPFDRAAAASAVRAAAASAASACSGETGSSRVSVTFAPSGRATNALLEPGSRFAGTLVGSCIANRMRTAQVPAFSGPRVTVHTTVFIP